MYGKMDKSDIRGWNAKKWIEAYPEIVDVESLVPENQLLHKIAAALDREPFLHYPQEALQKLKGRTNMILHQTSIYRMM